MGRHRLASVLGLVLAVGWIIFNASRGRYGNALAYSGGPVPVEPVDQPGRSWAESVAVALRDSAPDTYGNVFAVACLVGAVALLGFWPAYVRVTLWRLRAVRDGGEPGLRRGHRAGRSSADALPVADAALSRGADGPVMGPPRMRCDAWSWSPPVDGPEVRP